MMKQQQNHNNDRTKKKNESLKRTYDDIDTTHTNMPPAKRLRPFKPILEPRMATRPISPSLPITSMHYSNDIEQQTEPTQSWSEMPMPSLLPDDQPNESINDTQPSPHMYVHNYPCFFIFVE